MIEFLGFLCSSIVVLIAMIAGAYCGFKLVDIISGGALSDIFKGGW